MGELPDNRETSKAAGRRRRQLLWMVVPIGALLVAVAALLLTGVLGGEPQLQVGSGVSSDQAATVKRSFDSGRDALNRALAAGDPAAAQGKVTGNALRDLEQQIQTSRAQGQRLRRQVRPSRTEVLHETDPNDPGVVLEVHQTGSIHQDILGQTGDAVLSRSDLSYDGRYWMRAVGRVGDAYAITDTEVNEQPAVPAAVARWVLAVGLVLIVALVAVVGAKMRRWRCAPGWLSSRHRAPGPGTGAVCVPRGARLDGWTSGRRPETSDPDHGNAAADVAERRRYAGRSRPAGVGLPVALANGGVRPPIFRSSFTVSPGNFESRNGGA